MVLAHRFACHSIFASLEKRSRNLSWFRLMCYTSLSRCLSAFGIGRMKNVRDRLKREATNVEHKAKSEIIISIWYFIFCHARDGSKSFKSRKKVNNVFYKESSRHSITKNLEINDKCLSFKFAQLLCIELKSTLYLFLKMILSCRSNL